MYIPPIKIKKLHPDAVIPKYAKPGDAGFDLTAVDVHIDNDRNLGSKYYYRTGLAFEIPAGYVGLIFPRSSIFKTGMMLTNCVGVIDSGYRGEVSFIFRNLQNNPIYQIGDRIGQMIIMPFPHVEFQEVDELSDTERGTGGFGSSGS